jgi:hypothetical protein
MAVSFMLEMARFRPRSATGLKMHEDKLIKVTIWFSRTNERG